MYKIKPRCIQLLTATHENEYNPLMRGPLHLQELGKMLYERRKALKISYATLTKHYGLKVSDVKKIERGDESSLSSDLVTLAEALKAPLILDIERVETQDLEAHELIHEGIIQDLFTPKKPVHIPKGTLRSIDLFAGIGGIRMGFDQAFGDKICTVFVSEWDQAAQKTYSANYQDEAPIHGDITKIAEEDVPEFDICLAGFPCQAFSLAGQRKGFEDDYKGMSRGTLFFDVARICAYHKPKVIFCENVKGLTIHDKGHTFEVITKTLEQLGYKVFYKVLNSKDFGVPQNRERIYIVAFRKDLAPRSFNFPHGTGQKKCLADILEKNPVSAKYYLSERYLETLRRHKERHEAKGNGFGYEIRPLDGIAGAIVCGGMGRERNLIIDTRQKDLTPVTHIVGEINREGIRKMTPREWARLQGFPDSFKLPLSDVHLYKQLGNSVTVPVIKAIAEEIKKIIF